MSSFRTLCLGAAAMSVLGSASVFAADTNPFSAPSTLPYQTIPWDRIKDSDYTPAFEEAMKQQLAEIDAIANNPAPPTFDNTHRGHGEVGPHARSRARARFPR